MKQGVDEMKLNIPKELFDTYDDEQKAFLKENFTYHSSGDRCWHSKEGIEDTVPFEAITDGLGVYPSVTWSPTKEKYQSFSEEERAKIRELFFWNRKQAVWESQPLKGEQAQYFLLSINEYGGTDIESTLSKKLMTGLKEIRTSEQYKEWLNSMSKFTNYSVGNQIMIALQNPDATLVAGKAMWYKNFKRKLNHNAVGLYIKAPKIKEKIKATPEQIQQISEGKLDEKTLPKIKVIEGFFLTKVYDISETNGPELPKAPVHQLTGDVDNYELFKAAIIEAAKPSEVFFVPESELPPNANGCFVHSTKEIKVRDNMSPEQTIKTMLHEVAHSKMHDMDLETNQEVIKPRELKEFEAESAAYILCQKYGIDSSEYSFGYVAGWSQNLCPAELEKSLMTTAQTASQISKKIDDFFESSPHLEQQPSSSGTKLQLPEPILEPRLE